MKNTKGITLVALVITIIILLILAGITISQLTGSGLFEKAQLAEEKSKNAQEKEDRILDDYENKIGEYVDNTRDTVTIDREEYEQLKKKGTWELLATYEISSTELEKNVKDLKNYNSIALILYSNNGTCIVSSNIITYEMFKNLSTGYWIFYNANSSQVFTYVNYISDTKVQFAQSNVKCELYGIY